MASLSGLPAKRLCIFCGSPANSPEHIWSKWLVRGGYVKVGMREHESRSLDALDPSKNVTRRLVRSKGVLSTEVSCVCRPCNTGWMSRLDRAAKPALIPLVEGRQSSLDLAAQGEILASWAVLKSMVLECSNPETRTISQSQRTFLWRRNRPPRGLTVSLAAHAGVEKGDYHYAHRLFRTLEVNGIPESWRKPDGVLSTFVVGHLILQVAFYCGPHDRTPEFGGKADDAIVSIWPPAAFPLTVDWPPKVVLNGAGLAKFARADFGLG
jgi:hypothetical protein